MTWPTGRDQLTAHVAGEPVDGVQRCSRCDIVLHSNRSGADPMWYPGQLVGSSDTRMVRMGLQPDHGYRECES